MNRLMDGAGKKIRKNIYIYIYRVFFSFLSLGAAATTGDKMETSESSSLASSAAADEPWIQQQSGVVNGGVATPPLIDLSTGVMGLESLSPDEQQQSVGGPGSEAGPLFDPTTERNVTVLVGRTAHLHCRVRYLGNRTVSIYR